MYTLIVETKFELLRGVEKEFRKESLLSEVTSPAKKSPNQPRCERRTLHVLLLPYILEPSQPKFSSNRYLLTWPGWSFLN